MTQNQPIMLDMSGRRKLLESYQHIAVVGISANHKPQSYAIDAYLKPRYAGQTFLGNRFYASLTEAKDAGEQIEIVDVFRKANETLPVAEEAIEIGAQAVWLQLGILNDDTGKRVREAGLAFVQDHCIKVEHAQLIG